MSEVKSDNQLSSELSQSLASSVSKSKLSDDKKKQGKLMLIQPACPVDDDHSLIYMINALTPAQRQQKMRELELQPPGMISITDSYFDF